MLPALAIITLRRDLIPETVISALLAGFILVFGEALLLLFAPNYLKSYYLLYGKAELIFGIIPLTELVWGMAFAAIIGPLYDFDYGKGPINFPKSAKRRR